MKDTFQWANDDDTPVLPDDTIAQDALDTLMGKKKKKKKGSEENSYYPSP